MEVRLRKLLTEMFDKRDFGLDFREREDFELYVNEFYDATESEIREVWNLYRPLVIPEFDEFVDPWNFDRH